MENQTQQGHQPIVSVSTDVLHVSAEQLAQSFGKPVAAAEEIQRRQQSQLVTFYNMLVNSDDHLASILKRLTAKDRESSNAPTIMQDGKKRIVPALVKALVDQGYTPLTAENLFSNMMRMRQAYVDFRFVPEAGTPWKDAYTEATKLIGAKRKERQQSNRSEADDAKRNGFIANEIRKLTPEQRKDAQAVGEATMRGLDAYDEHQRRIPVIEAGIAAVAEIGEERIPELIVYLQQRLQEWQTKQSSKTVAPMEVPTAEQSNIQATEAPAPARAVNQ